MNSQRDGWRWFATWAAAGFALTFSVLAAMSVGLLTFPLALLLLVWLVRTARTHAIVGAAAGSGAVLLLIAFLNRDYNPCSGPLSLPPNASPASSVSCGGLDPHPWIVVGSIAVCVSLAGYLVFRTRGSRGRTAAGA